MDTETVSGDIIFAFTDDPDGTLVVGTRCVAFSVIGEEPPIRWLTEREVRGLVAAAQSWLDASGPATPAPIEDRFDTGGKG